MEASQPDFLPQTQKFVSYPLHRALPGRRPDKLRVFLARETGKGTFQFAGRERATVMQHRGDVAPAVEHRMQKDVVIARP